MFSNIYLSFVERLSSFGGKVFSNIYLSFVERLSSFGGKVFSNIYLSFVERLVLFLTEYPLSSIVKTKVCIAHQ